MKITSVIFFWNTSTLILSKTIFKYLYLEWKQAMLLFVWYSCTFIVIDVGFTITFTFHDVFLFVRVVYILLSCTCSIWADKLHWQLRSKLWKGLANLAWIFSFKPYTHLYILWCCTNNVYFHKVIVFKQFFVFHKSQFWLIFKVLNRFVCFKISWSHRRFTTESIDM
jgi:hypothetical protein